MITQLLCSINPVDLSDEQRMFLLRAVYGPTLAYQPKRTKWLEALLRKGLLREIAEQGKDFTLLHLTDAGREMATSILTEEKAHRVASFDERQASLGRIDEAEHAPTHSH